MSDDIAKTPCPGCGALALSIQVGIRLKELGSFSLAGQQMKASGSHAPILRCTECAWEHWGWFETGYACFGDWEAT